MKVKRLTDTAILPTKAHATDLGWDLYADEDVTLYIGEVKKIKTGIALELPEGYGAIIQDRSSMGAKGITKVGGVIDNGYKGEILVCLANINTNNILQYLISYLMMDYVDNTKSVLEQSLKLVENIFTIKKGDKVAQLVLVPTITTQLEEVENLTETDRGEKGFGSSGR